MGRRESNSSRRCLQGPQTQSPVLGDLNQGLSSIKMPRQLKADRNLCHLINRSHHDENSVRAKLELAKNAKLELTNSAKLEVTKRKLQEGYQEFDNAKKQRTIQMVDPQNLPKQANRNWQPNVRPRNNSNFNNNRNWSR